MFTDSNGKPFGAPEVSPMERLCPSFSPPKLIWEPLKGIIYDGKKLIGSQEMFMCCPAHHVLYHGTRGPGKTDAQVMLFRSMVGRGYGQFWKGVIFDRRYKNLDDLISKAKKWFFQFNDGVKFLSSQGDLKFVWPTGEELLFRKFNSPDDYYDYHGHEYPFIGWNELTKFATPAYYDLMSSCNRSSFIPLRHSPALTNEDHEILRGCSYDLEILSMSAGDEVVDRIKAKLLPPLPLWVRSTTNPYGPGRAWVKRRFIDAGNPGQLIHTDTEVYNPQTQKLEIVRKTQTHIFGSYMENIYLDPIYVAELHAIIEPNKREAWLRGNWNVTAGGCFDDLWRDMVHKKPRFKLPANWRAYRVFDWGSTAPFSYAIWAVANGEEVTLPDGTKFCPNKGSLVLCGEWYGCAKDAMGRPRYGDNVGIRLGSRKIGAGIKEREAKLKAAGWIVDITPGPADNQIRNVTDADTDTIEKSLAKEGIKFTESDKANGTLKIGVELMRDRLEASITGEGPGIYFMDNCRAHLALIPTLPRDEDDLDVHDPESEDHNWDTTRYMILHLGRKTPPKALNLITN